MRTQTLAALGFGFTVLVGMSGAVKADQKEYRFEAVETQIPAAQNGSVKIRLVHVPDGKPVTNAVLFQSKLEMAMQGMVPMSTKVLSVVPDGTGVYSVTVDFSMPGSWTLTVSAKVQGEAATIVGTVPVVAKVLDHGKMDGMEHGH
jgi:hypothetical protein